MQLRPPSSPQHGLARPIVDCAQCGERIYSADWSEYLDDRHVRHLWACEACGYTFETLVVFPAQHRPAA